MTKYYHTLIQKRKKLFNILLNSLYNLIKQIKLKTHFDMNDFWNNVRRYPRFFISSFIGLILVILTPIKNLIKIQKFRVFLVSIVIGFIIVIYFIIANMTDL